MSAQNEVINEWRERRDLTLAVKERVEHQIRALSIEIVPGKDADPDQQQRLEDLQFELGLLEEACQDAEREYQNYSAGSEPTERGEDHA